MATDRPRQWGAHIESGVRVSLRQYAVLNPDEDLNDDPPTITVPWADWQRDHEAVYGLTLDGRPAAGDNALRQAVARLKVKGQADLDWKALLVVLKAIANRANGSALND